MSEAEVLEEESILNSVKNQIGITTECTDFDPILVTHINSVLVILNQIGVGPLTPVHITGPNETWSILGDKADLRNVRSYVALKVRMLFDPPSASSANTAAEGLISEMEWRLNVGAETFEPRLDETIG